MAKCNTSVASEVERLFHDKTGLAILIRSDRAVLRRDPFSGSWKVWRKLKQEVTPQSYVQKLLSSPRWHVFRRGDIPSFAQIQNWSFDGLSEATDGCTVEPDGVCPHACPSWCRVFGMI